MLTARPFRAPHHSASAVSLVGGGPDAQPGELSFAHNGVLFLDELPEFDKRLLESLRQPLEDGFVSVARAMAHREYPSQVMLIAAMNPCPCGYFGQDDGRCRCTRPMVERYLGRVSGPLLDRFDLRVEVGAVPPEELTGRAEGELSEAVRARVSTARARQHRRFSSEPYFTNARMDNRALERLCALSDEARALLNQASARYRLTTRAHFRVLRAAQTIADLDPDDEKKEILPVHIAEALRYRLLDAKYWA
jgi:magnesium chelatase family protein